MKCDVPNCKRKGRKHLSRKFGTVISLCTGHHIAMHRLEHGGFGGISIFDLRGALGERQWDKILKRWTLKMGDDGHIHAFPREEKEKVIFT